jgi:inosine-uridine nucleoside N-ribohydrolase
MPRTILDTDIGTDIDDTWALQMILGSPEIDLRLAVTATGDTLTRNAKFGGAHTSIFDA